MINKIVLIFFVFLLNSNCNSSKEKIDERYYKYYQEQLTILEENYRGGSVNKIDYIGRKTSYMMYQKKYDSLISIYNKLDSSYFSFPQERKIRLMQINALQFKNKGDRASLDSVNYIKYKIQYYIESEQHKTKDNYIMNKLNEEQLRLDEMIMVYE